MLVISDSFTCNGPLYVLIAIATARPTLLVISNGPLYVLVAKATARISRAVFTWTFCLELMHSLAQPNCIVTVMLVTP